MLNYSKLAQSKISEFSQKYYHIKVVIYLLSMTNPYLPWHKNAP